MIADEMSFEGLEPIEARLIHRAHEVGYVTLQDRTEPGKAETLGRFDLDEASAEPYLASASTSRGPRSAGEERSGAAEGCDRDDDAEDPDDPDGDDDTGDDEDEPDDEDLPEAGDDPGWPPSPLPDDDDEPIAGPLTPVDLARAACRWIRDCAARNTVGEPFCRFRVRVYSPKGLRQLESGQFVCRNHDYEDLDDGQKVLAELKIPAPTFDQAATQGAIKGIKALGDYYAQWGQIVLGSVGQLQGVNNAMLARLHRQLQESRGQVDQLVAAILEARVAEVQAHDGRRAEEYAADNRSQLARDALTQLGQAAQTFLLARGVPQDLVDSFQSISSSPDLVAALRDPRVLHSAGQRRDLSLIS